MKEKKYYIYIASETRVHGEVTSLHSIKFPVTYEQALQRAEEQRLLINTIDKLRR